jgi:hypothetical protein
MIKKLYPIHLYLKALPNIITLGSSLILNILIWVWLFWEIRPQADSIFLHYNILFGVDYLGPWWQIALLPSAGLSILIVNAILGWVLYGRDSFAAYLLNTTATFSQIIILISSYLLINLNV